MSCCLYTTVWGRQSCMISYNIVWDKYTIAELLHLNLLLLYLQKLYQIIVSENSNQDHFQEVQCFRRTSSGKDATRQPSIINVKECLPRTALEHAASFLRNEVIVSTSEERA